MRYFPHILILAFLNLDLAAQQKKTAGLAQGEVLHEVLNLLDSSEQTVQIVLPSNEPILFYRYRSQNWLPDNGDSVIRVDAIVNELRRSSKKFAKLRLVCYYYNEDHYIRSPYLPRFPAGTSYSVGLCHLNKKPNTAALSNGKLLLLDANGLVLENAASLSAFNYKYTASQKTLKGKLLTEQAGKKVPVPNASVCLRDRSGNPISAGITDKYGDFALSYSEDAGETAIQATITNEEIKTLILATQEGMEISRLQRSGSVFEMKIIEAEIVRLSPIHEERDLDTQFLDFLSKKSRELLRTEYINYASGSYMLPEETKPTLDRIAALMNDHPDLKLIVTSHTDARGDARANLLLSEKRSLSVVSYLILIGVHKDRLTFTGKGEQEIMNRCGEGVDCSDNEHRYNRRTEFRFVREK